MESMSMNFEPPEMVTHSAPSPELHSSTHFHQHQLRKSETSQLLEKTGARGHQKEIGTIRVASIFVCYHENDRNFGEGLAWDLEDLGFDVRHCNRQSCVSLRSDLNNFLEKASYYMVIVSQACYETLADKRTQGRLDAFIHSYTCQFHPEGKEKVVLPILLGMSPVAFAQTNSVFARLATIEECTSKDADCKSFVQRFSEDTLADSFCGPCADVWSWRKENISTSCGPALFQIRRVQVYISDKVFEEVDVIHDWFEEIVGLPIGSRILKIGKADLSIVFNPPVAMPVYARETAASWKTLSRESDQYQSSSLLSGLILEHTPERGNDNVNEVKVLSDENMSKYDAAEADMLKKTSVNAEFKITFN
eukprot:m.135784 g.135784  ORF g.135784 m.135784 type:complete len:364 (+) comp38167_c0_seq4:819-1910(+)